MKKSITSIVLAVIITLTMGCSSKTEEDFTGLYDDKYNYYEDVDYKVENGVIANFESELDLLKNLKVFGFKGKMSVTRDPAFVTLGKGALKIDAKNNNFVLKFKTSSACKNITTLDKILLDIMIESDDTLSITPSFSSTESTLEYKPTVLQPNSRHKYSFDLTKSVKDEMALTVGFDLGNITEFTFKFDFSGDSVKDRTVYIDGLKYSYGDKNYEKPVIPMFNRDKGEINCFNVPQSLQYLNVYYAVGIEGYKNDKSKIHATYSPDFCKSGDGGMRVEVEPIELSKDSTVFSYPTIEWKKDVEIGSRNHSSYNTFSFWIYYKSGPSRLDNMKMVFDTMFNSTIPEHNITSDILIPKGKWVNVKVNYNLSRFENRDNVYMMLLWTYGLNVGEENLVYYIDEITLSNEKLPSNKDYTVTF